MKKILAPATLLLLIAYIAVGCKGRTAENMTPAGETIEVIIPEGDVAQDSIIANPGVIVDSL